MVDHESTLDGRVFGEAVAKLAEDLFFFQAEDGIRDLIVTGVQTCALPILAGMCPTVARSDRSQSVRVPLRVLIAEDSEDDAGLLLRELQRAGFDPAYERVDSPTAMQAALDRQAWDLVIGDYSMPAFSGPAALALLRACDLDTPFIFVSGTIGEDVAVEAMKAGAQDFLTKGNLRRLIQIGRAHV